ncbi:hypothetical protein ACFYWY_06140 [Streptomyces sp. NPDC002870]|uniref:hypothetical protein n=1 Tax=Streptomyces sp. NPDC002870 TaxID=3364666 RepID=UPI0036A67C59
MKEIDCSEVVEYHEEWVSVPRSAFARRIRIPLKYELIPETWIETEEGNIVQGALNVTARWWKRTIAVTYKGPSRAVHKDEIDRIRQQLESMTRSERNIVHEVSTSNYSHPVVFISHRWEAEEHPDPSGDQLIRLQALQNCWVIYDYSSFPQLPRSNQEEAEFEQILRSMDELIQNVVILDSPDYLTRGWCVYEYITASLKNATVCDEIQDPALVSLRNWAATKPPFPRNLVRDSLESMQSNYINQMALESVNQVLRRYQVARFKTEHDHSAVTGLLQELLKRKLPVKKTAQPYFGEWVSSSWTDDELSDAFNNELEIPTLESIRVRPFNVDVPRTITEAVCRKYKIQEMSWGDRFNQSGLGLM